MRAGTSNPSSGSYVTTTSSDGTGSTLTNTVDCVTGQVTAAVDAGTCSGTSSTPKVTITNGTNATQYVDVQYKIGSGGTWTDLADGSSISAGAFTIFTLGSAQAHNTEVYFQFRFDTSNPSSGSYITTQNTDGAGAGSTLLATVDCEVPDPSAAQAFTSTCSAGARTNTLTLSNSASANVPVYFYVEYSLDGGSSWTEKAANQSVAVDSSETLTQSVAHGETITWRYKTSSTSGSFTNDYTTMSASSAVDCDPDITVSSSFGNCSSGAKLSTLSLENNESSTVYVKVEYSIDGGTYQTKTANLSINGSATDTSQTHSVADGQTIAWRITDAFDSDGNFTNMTAETQSTSSPVDCDPETNLSTSLSTCSAGAKTSTFSIQNTESATVYYKVEYQIDSGSFQTANGNLSVSGNSTDTSQTASVPDGSTITWRITDSFTSNDFTNMSDETMDASDAVDCDPDITVVNPPAIACAGSQGSSTISITNNESSTVYVKVEYKIDDGSYQTANANLSIANGATDTSVSQNVANGSKITWRVTDSFTSGDFTNMSAETQTQSSTVDCLVPTTFSSSFGNCSSGAQTNTASITNDSGATAYYLVEYKIDDGSYQVAATNLSVAAGATDTSLSASVPHGSTITWQFKDSSTDGNFSGASYEEQTATSAVDCDPATFAGAFGTNNEMLGRI